MLTRIFNWLTGDASVDGVSPALHRRALWVAFEVLLIASAMSLVLTYAYLLFIFSDLRVPFGVFRAMAYIPSLQLDGVPESIAVPLLVYALVLRLKGASLPAPIVLVASALLAGMAIGNWRGSPFFFPLSGSIALIIIILVAQGLLRRRITTVTLAVALLLAAVNDAWAVNYFRLSAQGQELSSGAFTAYRDMSLYLAPPLSLIIAIILPLSLMSSPRPRRPRPAFIFRLDFTWLMLALILLLGAANAVGYRYHWPLVPYGIKIGLTLVAVTALWWALLHLGGDARLTQFLLLSVAGFTAIWSFLPGSIPGVVQWLIAAVGGGILALWLAAPARLPRANYGYFAMGVINAVGAVIYYSFGVHNLAKLHMSFNPAPVALTVKLGCAFALELALVLAAALFLWASVRPGEVRELVWPTRPVNG